MELRLIDCSEDKFIQYSIRRIDKCKNDNKYRFSYISKARLRSVFNWMCKRRLKCSGCTYYISDCDGFISKFSNPEEETMELMEEMLFHEVWCKCEWIYRIIDKEREFYDSLKGYIGSKTVKNFEAVM